jgi:hypothetical protein
LFPHSRKYGTYLFKDQSGIYYFRIIVPAFLRDIYPNIQKEYRRSLATSISLYFEIMEKFNITVRNAETFDQVIRHIPAYFYLNSDLPDSMKMEQKGVYGQILKAKQRAIRKPLLRDITNGQSDLLKLIESNMDVIIEACEYDNCSGRLCGGNSSTTSSFFVFRWLSIFWITNGSSMLAITLTAPPHCSHVSMSMLKTRLSLCAQVIDWCFCARVFSCPVGKACLVLFRKAGVIVTSKGRESAYQ